jgi:hypothetical protein
MLHFTNVNGICSEHVILKGTIYSFTTSDSPKGWGLTIPAMDKKKRIIIAETRE